MNRDLRVWHPRLRINRVLRVMLQTRWSREAWSQVRVDFKRALALRSEIRRAGDSVAVTKRCSCGAVLVHVVAFG